LTGLPLGLPPVTGNPLSPLVEGLTQLVCQSGQDRLRWRQRQHPI